MPLCPPNRLEECRVLISAEIDSICGPVHIDLRQWLQDFVSYINDTWFRLFMPDDWNQYDSLTYEHLTNNCSGKTDIQTNIVFL